MRSMKLDGTLAPAMICCLVLTSSALAAPISVKLTSEALGLGSDNINAGSTVDPDIPGALVTSPSAGMGSILTVQQSGLAGPGSGANPLFVTITAKTHVDTLYSLPAVHDYQAGVLYISDEDSHTPDGRKEGIGVRAFGVDGLTGLRTFDGGLANIEGSKHVSGGTGPGTYLFGNPNGAPHVDELVNFEYATPVFGQSIEVLLSEYESTDIIDLHIEVVGGSDIDLQFLGTSDATLFEEIGDKLWKVTFDSPTIGLEPDDLVSSFYIGADDDVPADPRGTAEHFWITGTSAVVPEPATLSLLALGGLLAIKRRR